MKDEVLPGVRERAAKIALAGGTVGEHAELFVDLAVRRRVGALWLFELVQAALFEGVQRLRALFQRRARGGSSSAIRALELAREATRTRRSEPGCSRMRRPEKAMQKK